jgi:hypothetical protein
MVLGLLIGVTSGAVGLVLLADSDDEPESTSGPPVPTPPPDALVVVESGGEPYHDQIYDQQQFGWAIVVTNTSDRVATEVHVIAEFQNADTRVVESRDEVVHVLFPGDEVGLGGIVERDDVRRFDVTALLPGDWADPEDFGRIVTSDVTHRQDELGNPEVVFEADSTYDRPLRSPIIRVVLRNTAGDLIGGAIDSSTGFLEPDGHLRDSIVVATSFTDIDPDKTEVFLDPVDDLASGGPG